MKPPRLSNRFWITSASLLIHGVAAGFTIVAPHPERPSQPIAITVAEISIPKAPEPPPPPPVEEPPPKEEPAPAPKPAPPPPKPKPPAPKPAEPPPAPAAEPPADGASAPFADLGLVMGGGGPGGVAVAQAGARRAAAADRPKVASVQKGPPPCAEPATKAKPKKIVRPEYTEEARQAEIEGPVRLEVVIGDRGSVVSARVLKGIGYGLDEAAVAAAKAMIFEPSTRCGRPVESTLTFNMRFSLGS